MHPKKIYLSLQIAILRRLVMLSEQMDVKTRIECNYEDDWPLDSIFLMNGVLSYPAIWMLQLETKAVRVCSLSSQQI